MLPVSCYHPPLNPNSNETVPTLNRDKLAISVVVRFVSLPLGEGRGERLTANCNHNIVPGFSPQSVQGLFAASISLKNRLVASHDNGLKPGEYSESALLSFSQKGEGAKRNHLLIF